MNRRHRASSRPGGAADGRRHARPARPRRRTGAPEHLLGCVLRDVRPGHVRRVSRRPSRPPRRPSRPTWRSGSPTRPRRSPRDKSTWLAQGVGGAGLDVLEGVRRHRARPSCPLGAYVAGTAATASRLRRRHGLRRRLPGRLRDRTGRGQRWPAPDRPPSRRRRSGSPASPPVPGAPSRAELTVSHRRRARSPSTTTTPLTFSPATATAGPTLTMDTRPAVTPPVGYLSAELSLNTIALNLNGLVTEAAAGAVNPPVAFVRQSPLCTTRHVHARGQRPRRPPPRPARSTQTITGCPAAPALVSVAPGPGQPPGLHVHAEAADARRSPGGRRRWSTSSVTAPRRRGRQHVAHVPGHQPGRRAGHHARQRRRAQHRAAGQDRRGGRSAASRRRATSSSAR